MNRDMPFINVATAWKELSTSRVVANETQPLRESPPQIITEEASIISTNEGKIYIGGVLNHIFLVNMSTLKKYHLIFRRLDIAF